MVSYKTWSTNLTADIEDFIKPADIATNKENYLIKNVIPVRYKQDFINVTPSDFIYITNSSRLLH
jgi:hypothetical protein